MDNLALIDHIYEAAFVPDHWETVCELLSTEVDSFSAALIAVAGEQSYRWVCSPNARDGMEQFSSSPLRFQNVRPQRHHERALSSFMRDIDLMSEEELANDPIYNEFLRPRGLGWTVGDMFQEPSGHMVIFDIIRTTAAGPFETHHVDRLNILRPHLARAATMSSRLAFERVNAAVEALELTGLPAAIIGLGGKVLAANSLLQDFDPQITITAYDRLRFDYPGASNKFESAVKGDPLNSAHGCSFPIPQTGGSPPAVVHLVPVLGNARDVFVHAQFVLVVTPVDRSRVPTAETIQGLFDLSPAEARIARSISMGSTVTQTAHAFSLSAETVRSHVKSILGKSGMTRQTDFVAAVTSIRPVGKPGQ